MLNARCLIALLLALSLPAHAAGSPPPRIGFVAPQGRNLPLFDAFKQGLAEAGYTDGRDVVIEARFADGNYQRFPEIFAELQKARVDVVVVTGAVTARAARKAIADLPIVFAMVVDPVSDNVVASYEHPGGNCTGTTSFDPQQPTRQFALLRKMLPGMKRVAILGDQGVSSALIDASEAQARAAGLVPIPIRLAGPNPNLDETFATVENEKADALVVLEEPVLGVHAAQIADAATARRIPTLFPPSRAAAGGLVSFGTSQVQAIRRMAVHVSRILKGAKPADLAVEKVAPYELVVNLKTARQIGVRVPDEVLKQADRVVE